jgi:CDP-diacylglycerol--serine O-phosphatidyltransferase
MNTIPGMVILAFYCLAGLIRLAYFNVMEETRQKETDEKRKYYQGLPITSIAVILPLVYLGSAVLQNFFVPVLHVAMLITGILFILNFRFRKPTNRELVFLIAIVALAVLYIVIFYKWKGIFRWNWRSLSENIVTG